MYYGTNASGIRGWYAYATGDINSIGTIDSGTASLNGATISGNALIMQSASSTRPGLVNNTAQTFSGNKTFSGTIGASNFSGSSSGTNTGDVSIGTANGLSLVNQVLSLGTSSASTTGALTSADWMTFAAKQDSVIFVSPLDETAGNVTCDVASGSQAGCLSSTDWTTFNNKVATTRSISTTTPLQGGGNLSADRTFSILQSGAAQDGYLSSTDWTTFNNKVSTTRSISTTTPLQGGGNLSADRTFSILQSGAAQDGYLSSTDWNIFNDKQDTLTIGDLTVTGSPGISVTNGTGSVIGSGTSITQQVATSGQNGYLSSTDWSTFNSKQAAGNYITALTGDGTASGPGSSALTLATVNSNVGSFGSASSVATFTANAKGLVTAAGSTAIQIAESQVTNLVTDLAGKQPTGNYITALTGDITASGPGSATAAIASGVIVNADVNASAAIAGSKIDPDFGAQNMVTTGTLVLGTSPAVFSNTKFGLTNAVTPASTTNASGITNVVDVSGNAAITTGSTIGYFGRTIRTITSTTTDTSNSDFLGLAAQYRLTPSGGAVYTYSGAGYLASANFAMPTENGAGSASVPRVAALLLSGGGGAAFATRASHISFGALPTQATNNAYMSDNDAFSGNYFIHSTNTNPTVLSGALTTPYPNSNVSSADTSPTASGTHINMTTGASNRTVNLPACASNTGMVLSTSKVDTGVGYVFIDPNGAETINGYSKVTLHLQGEAITYKCNGTSWWITGYTSSKEASWTPTYSSSGAGSWGSVTTTFTAWWKSAIDQVSFQIQASGTVATSVLTMRFTVPVNTIDFAKGISQIGSGVGVVGLNMGTTQWLSASVLSSFPYDNGTVGAGTRGIYLQGSYKIDPSL